MYEVDTWQGHWSGGWCATSLCDLDLITDLALMPLTLKSCSGYMSETVSYRKLILDRDIG